MVDSIVTVKNLSVSFSSNNHLIKAVDNISFEVPRGKTFAIVGESGSGKSVTAMSIMRLIPKNRYLISSGSILFNNLDLLKVPEKEMIKIRGKDISMIFQEPMSSLNPVMKIGDQIKEVAIIHNGLKKHEAEKKSVEMLEKLGITSPNAIINKYPHQMSGGMQQRIMIAIAIICTPKLLIADEPTTSLDVTIQALIIDIIKRLQKILNMSIIFISHDLGVVAEIADFVSVMFSGKIVEITNVMTFFGDAKHPYSLELLNLYKDFQLKENICNENIYQQNCDNFADNTEVKNNLGLSKGCKFYRRCSKRIEKCNSLEPELKEVKDGHKVACWNLIS